MANPRATTAEMRDALQPVVYEYHRRLETSYAIGRRVIQQKFHSAGLAGAAGYAAATYIGTFAFFLRISAMPISRFARRRSRGSLEADQPFRSKPITAVGPETSRVTGRVKGRVKG